MMDRNRDDDEVDIKADDKDYFTKRCVCCTFWITFTIVLLSCLGVAAQIWIIGGGEFLSGATVQDKEAPPVVEEVEGPWEWKTASDDLTKYFTPKIADWYGLGDDDLDFDLSFPTTANKMYIDNYDIRMTGILYKTFGNYLSGIQLIYSDGNISPPFENASSANAKRQEIVVPADANIRWVYMA